jgi:hypothetical protein
MRILWIGAFLLGLAVPANANVSGITLKQKCDAPDGSPSALYCLAYMTGVLDTIRGLGNVGDKKIFCEPDMITGEQLLGMLRKIPGGSP